VTSAPDTFSASRLSRARTAVGVCFFVNAVLYANVVPRLPEVKAELGLSNSSLGAAIAAMPLGALVAGLSAAALMRRFGSARVASRGLVVLALAVFVVAVAPNWGVLAAAFLVAGALDAIVDVSQNAHGLRVQRLYQRSILNAFHGIWSIGAVAGGLLGSVAAGLEIPLLWHLGGVAVVFSAVALAINRAMLPGADDSDRVEAAADAAHRPCPPAAARAAPRSRRWPPWACSRRAGRSSRTPGPPGARSTSAPSSRPRQRSPGWGSSRSRWP
jgi:MFS family permease